MKGIGLAHGVCRSSARDDQRGEMFVACPPRAVFAVAHASGPRCAGQLKFAAPTARDIDHLVRELRRGHDGGSQPVQVHGAVRIECGLAGDDVGLIINCECDGESEAVGGICIGEREAVCVVLRGKAKLWQQRRAVGVAHDQSRLAREGARGLWADRQVRVFVKHTARDVDDRCGVQVLKDVCVRQGRPPVGHDRKAVEMRRQNKCLTAII